MDGGTCRHRSKGIIYYSTEFQKWQEERRKYYGLCKKDGQP